MARMHSRKHGKHGSTKPIRKKPSWLMYDKEEIEQLILKLAREGMSNAQIGLVLRDQYGVPDVRALDLRVAKVVKKEITKDVPEELYNQLVKAVNLHKHLQQNKKDALSVHSIQLIESKIRRLAKYYVRKGELPKDWKYSMDKAKLIVK